MRPYEQLYQKDKNIYNLPFDEVLADFSHTRHNILWAYIVAAVCKIKFK